MRLLRGSLLAALLLLACAKTSSITEQRPLVADFDGYRSGAVEIDPRNMVGGEKGSRELLTYLEAKLKQGGVLEPIEASKGAQLILRIRATSLTGEDDVRFIVDFVDAKTGETIGQVVISANSLGNKGNAALRRVADEIVTYMRTNRRAPVVAKASPAAKGGSAASAPTVLAPAGAATDRPVGPGVVTSGGCTTTCTPDSSSAFDADDQKKIADGFQPLLKLVRVCLDRVNAQEIRPAVIARFETSGAMSALKVDAGGYDDLACVQDARSHAQPLTISRGASVRCEYRCAK